MKVLHLSTFDTAGGAARASYRIHQGLRNIGIHSQMLVGKKASDDENVIEPTLDANPIVRRTKAELNSLMLKPYPKCVKHSFSSQRAPDRLAKYSSKYSPDIIHLHWIASGYLQVESLARFNKPIVWTLMDMWPFTGGCHYAQECDRYTRNCGACPQLGSDKAQDLSRKVWQRKEKAWRSIDLTVVAPSNWIASCARNSSLLSHASIKVIPFGLDTAAYKPIDQKIARAALKLPQNKKLVLFGAISAVTDQRKGFHILQTALQKLAQSDLKDDTEAVIFGSSKPDAPIDLGLPSNYLGHLKDDISLAQAYSAADVMVTPSTQEAFGQTASEAMACGTPVVAFDNTGLSDIVDHQKNGYLASLEQVDDLAQGLRWVLTDSARHQHLCNSARRTAETKFTTELQANRYVMLYQKILEKTERQQNQFVKIKLYPTCLSGLDLT